MLNVPQEVKDFFHFDTWKKNIRIHFPNGERTDICNNLIVLNSVSFKESLCSQETLKFGLCEAPVFECEVVGVGNIKGATIEVFCEVYCDPSVSGAVFREDLQSFVYPVPYGTFIVDSCKRQGDIIHRKIIAYGGPAAKGWAVLEQETDKLNANGAVYTPIVPFFLASNDIYFFDNIVNESMYLWTGSGASSIGSSYKINSVEIYPGRYYEYSVRMRANACYKRWGPQYDTNYNNLYRIKADIVGNKEQFKKQLSDIINEWGTLDKNLIDWFAGNAFLGQLAYTNSAGWRKTVYGGDGGLSEKYIYPFVDGLYVSNSTLAEYVRPEVVTVEITRLDTAVPSPLTVVDSFEFRILSEAPTIYIQEIKNTAQVLALQMSFEMTKDPNYQIYTPDFGELDLRSITNAFSELLGGFVYYDRAGRSKYVNIRQQFGLLPGGTLYPDSELYPGAPTGGALLPKDYQSCWYDDEYTLPFGAIQCTYKNSNNEDLLLIYYLTGYSERTPREKYRVYDLSDNFFIKNGTWTQAQIESFCSIIAENIEGVSYIPVDFKGRGLPYVEAGDTFEILTKSGDSITTIVLNKTTTGEQTLTDNYKSNGTGTGTITV